MAVTSILTISHPLVMTYFSETLTLFSRFFLQKSNTSVGINLRRIAVKKQSTSAIMNENIIKLNSTPGGVIKEGQAEILEPPGRKVFYNPVQEFNRDLSVLALHVFSSEYVKSKQKLEFPNEGKVHFRVLEALSATGLRSIRYAKEIPNVTQIIANDISEKAIQNMTANIEHNKVENLVEVSHMNAVKKMQKHTEVDDKFQAVDLDPYGSPAQFLDSAVQCVADGGMLLVTCTDMAILCGNFPETCYTKYGGISLKCSAQHEMALRIVLQNIQSHASRYKRYIVPLLAISADFYVRIFVKLYTSAAACKHVTSNLSMVYHCTSCDVTNLQPLGVTKKGKNNDNIKYCLPHAPLVGMKCVHCGGNHHMGGPIWSGPLHDQVFVSEMLKSEKLMELNTSKRLIGVLSMVREELDIPLFYFTPKMSSVLKCTPIPMMTIRSAILNGNYRVSYSHTNKESVKTDAPPSFIWDVMRQWAKENPPKSESTKEMGPANNILQQPIVNNIDFTHRSDANPVSRENKLTRFQQNPMPHWGPGSKSTTKFLEENPKRKRNQNTKRYKRKKKSESNETSNKESLTESSENDEC